MKRARSAWFWPLLVGALFVLGIGANLILLVVATSDPSAAVEPNYYEKALAWDRTQAEAAHSRELGWNVAIAVARLADPTRGELTAVLCDRGGEPLSGAAVEIEAFHNARSALRLSLRPMEDGATGVYRATIPRPRPGLWEFRVRATRGGELFTGTLLQDIAP